MKKLVSSAIVMLAILFVSDIAYAQDKKPNILVIWGDDIGYWNVSAYNQGMMGYRTPNIDRIAKEGMLFTDAYGEQSCTAGRAAFVTGQSGFRTGLLKVGLPGAKEGLKGEDPTIAELLKPHGYMTGQFGKNHLGDLDEMLPTNHGFDEFFGNLYHLNAEEEPENPDYPKDPEFKKKFGPRGVIRSTAGGSIEDTGPLTKKRMETVDEETLGAAMDFMDRAVEQEKPFFVWWNGTRMHIFTHLKEESQGKTGLGVFADGMVEHDGHVGQLLDKLDELGIADNTIVMYSTDNGAEVFSWPDGGTTPFRGEKNENWEGGYRVPKVVGDKTFKVHLDGYNFLPYLKGETETGPRREFFYFSDTGDLLNLRYNNWKVVFAEQRSEGLDVWQDPFTTLRLPKLFNLRTDPFELADHIAIGYDQWRIERVFALVPAQAFVAQFLSTFRDYPPRQEPGSFSLDQVLRSLQTGSVGQ
jgi:arylsulfatase